MPNMHELRTRIDDPSILARYLPAAIVSDLMGVDSASASPHDLEAHIARLQELLQLIVCYVPEHVAVLRSGSPLAQIGHLSRSPGTLLSADLSGFTAFSARLSTLGSEGAELVARTVSELFSALLAALSGWGGNLLKLSGDALTAMFSGPDHERRAVAAAIDLQARMDAFENLATPAGVFTLRMRIGVASGAVLLAEVGTRERIELLVAGATARRVVEIQRFAPPGAVVIDSTTYQAIAPVCRALTVGAGLYRVLAIDGLARPEAIAARRWTIRGDPGWELHALVARLEAFRPYLVDQHLARLAADPLADEGDLRPVTVLFVCLSDAGALLEGAAPGDRELEVLQTRVRRIWELIDRHGGTINKIDLHPDGHTLMALFGAPVAQGHDAERAVSCALALLNEGAARHAGEANAAPLMVRRIGIATGQVFAGAVGSAQRREYTVMGSVVNLAARLMDVADEGQALIGAVTAHAVRRWFQLRELPPVLVKGYDEPIALYAVAAEQQSRLGTLLHEQGPLVGRQAELALAQPYVARALAGRGAVVALTGEAGIGKSRLLAAIVRAALAAEPRAPAAATAIVQVQPHSRGRPYALITELVRQLYDLPDQPAQAAQAIAAHVYERTPAHERFLPLLLAMLGLPGEASMITQALTPEERRAKLHGLVIALLAGYARNRPALLVLEDLHWADAASLDLLGELAVACAALPLVILCTYRPEDAPAWPAEADVTAIALHGLTPDQSLALFSERLGGLALPDDMRAAAVERTQGNPFFIEETVRTLREQGLDTHGVPPLPTTVQGALQARLDRLPAEERYVLQIASVIGPLFQRSLLAHLTLDRVPLERALEHLTERGLLRLDSAGGDHYAFAHSLTQETAYESLLFAQRRDIHRHVADRLRAANPACADEEPGLLAFHYRRAEAWEEVLEFSRRAGARAQALYAGDLALTHYQRALEAADQLDSATARRVRPAVLQSCGNLHTLAGRYAEAVAAYRAAIASSDDDSERAQIFICWAEVYEQQAVYDEALALLDQAGAALAPLAEDPLMLRIAVRRGWILARQGAVEEARAAVEPCLERLEALERWPDLLLAYKVFFHIAAGQGRWSEARAYLRLALASAERAGDIREIARIHNNLGVVLLNEGNLRRAAESFERCAHVIEEIGDRYNLALIKVNTGVIYYKLGDTAAALDCYNTSLRIATAIGAPLAEASARSNLGEIYRQLGRLPESIEQLLRSAELSRQMRDDLGLAEAYRQLGETYIALDRLAEAEQAYDQARATAIAAGDPQAEAIAYRVGAMLAAARGDYDTALDNTQRSIRLLTDLGSAQELGQSMIVQATILMHEGQADAARATLEEAIRLFQKAGADADMTQAEQLLDTIHLQAPLEEVYR